MGFRVENCASILEARTDFNSEALPAGVYVATTADGWPSKIGVTSMPTARMKGLQTGNWHRIRMHSFRFAADLSMMRRQSLGGLRRNMVTKSAERLEWLTMKALKNLDVHISGEWFDAEAHDLAEMIARTAERFEIELLDAKGLLDGQSAATDSAQMVVYGQMVNAMNDAIALIESGNAEVAPRT